MVQMRALRYCGLTALLKATGCECFWTGARATGCARHRTLGHPSMSFVEAEKVKSVTGPRSLFRPSTTRMTATASGGDTATISGACSPMDTASLEFSSETAHHEYLKGQGKLPLGFRVGTDGFRFVPREVPTEVTMNVTAIVMDEPSDRWAAVFTRNMFPGAPVVVGKERLAAEGRAIQAVVVNNKISNVCPGGEGKGGAAAGVGGVSAGVASSESICERMADVFGLEGGAGAVVPCSTGVIGWRLPVEEICDSLVPVKAKMQSDSMFPASKSIMTTDRYPKMRGTDVGSSGGRLVGIAKGAGMIEPDMATMLVYLVTDLQIPREKMRELLSKISDASFNCISIDSDTSTSDTVLLLSSGKVPLAEGDLEEFEQKLEAVCGGLAEDVVRNGEGTAHVMQVSVKGAPSASLARRLGKAVVNSPLFKAAVAGNDPNVGRLLAVVGRVMGRESPETDVSKTRISLGGHVVFEKNTFAISPAMETELSDLFKRAEMTTERGEHLPYPPHFRVVPIEIDLGAGDGSSTVLGSDLTAEYVHINGDYRS